VTSEAAFSYLARDFGLKEASIWAINADSQGSPQQVRRIIDLMRDNEIPVIFSESTVSPKPAEQVARETGAAYGGVLYVDSLSTPDGPVPTYLDLLRVTSETIVAAARSASWGFRCSRRSVAISWPTCRRQRKWTGIVPRAGGRRGDDGPLWPHELAAHARPPTAQPSPRRWSGSA
jgi:hypothetical protein